MCPQSGIKRADRSEATSDSVVGELLRSLIYDRQIASQLKMSAERSSL